MKYKAILLRGLVLVASLAVAVLPANAFDSCRAADFNDDGLVNVFDILIYTSAVNTVDPRVDLDGSGLVNEEDYPFIEAFFGQTCTGCTANLVDVGAVPGLDRVPTVDGDDRAALEAAYGTDCRGDLNRDGTVDQDGDIDLFVFYNGRPAPVGSPEARADFNGNGVVDTFDLLAFLDMVGNDCSADLNKDGAIDTNDLWAMLASWGICP